MGEALPAARYRAVACFYGLLDILHAPLARFVASRRINNATSLATDANGVRVLLQLVLDHWATDSRTHDPTGGLSRDAQLVLRVHELVFDKGYVQVATVTRAVGAAVRLLNAVDADHDAQLQARALCDLLGMDVEVRGQDETGTRLRREGDGDQSARAEARTGHLLDKWNAEVNELVKQGRASATRSNHKAANKFFARAMAILNEVDITAGDAVVATKKLKVLGHYARSALAAQQFQSTLDLARRGLEINAEWVEGQRLVCRASEALGRWSEALHACELVLARAPQDTVFQVKRQELASKLPPAASTKQSAHVRAAAKPEAQKPAPLSWQARVDVLVARGLMCQQKKKHKEAEGRFSDALGILKRLPGGSSAVVDSTRVKLLGHRARCRLAMDNYKLAAVDARAGLACDRAWVDGNRLLCKALMGQAAWREAMNACAQVLKRAPQDTAFLHLQQQLLEKCKGETTTGRTTPSAGGATSSAGQTFQSMATHVVKLFEIREFSTAKRFCSEAIELLTTRTLKDIAVHEKTDVYIHRALCHVECGAFDAVLQDARAALALNPHVAEALRLECIALMRLGRWHEANTTCGRALVHLPTDVTLLTCRAEITGKLDEQTCAESESSNDQRLCCRDRAASPDVEMDQIRLSFARQGSVVAQRYVSAHGLVSWAHYYRQNGEVRRAFLYIQDAMELWPRLEIPRTLLDAFHWIDASYAIEFGGAVLFAVLQAKEIDGSVSSQLTFWANQVDQHPDNADFHARLADVFYRAGNSAGSLAHMEKAIALKKAGKKSRYWNCGSDLWLRMDFLRGTLWSWRYLRARCLPLEADASPSWLPELFTLFKRESRPAAYFAYVQGACMDDEWMPHACYSLGMLYLAQNDYGRAKQFQFIAHVAEYRREQLGLFSVLDAASFPDKKLLNDAFDRPLMMLSASEQQAAVAHNDAESKYWQCSSCNTVPADVAEFVFHKLAECASRPSWAANDLRWLDMRKRRMDARALLTSHCGEDVDGDDRILYVPSNHPAPTFRRDKTTFEPKTQ